LQEALLYIAEHPVPPDATPREVKAAVQKKSDSAEAWKWDILRPHREVEVPASGR
jgi:hypothetical protein